jgi:hypothetical protein
MRDGDYFLKWGAWTRGKFNFQSVVSSLNYVNHGEEAPVLAGELES